MPDQNPDTNNQTGAKFMDALQQIERSGDVSPLVAMFTDDATLAGIVDHRTHEGTAGAEKFWTEYLSAFEEVHSTFGHVADGDGVTVLEWTSKGSLKAGRPIEYRGCSILELEGEKVKRFRTYYDSAAFLDEGTRELPPDPAAD